MKTIFLFISHHSHISDMLYTEYIKYLGGKFRVVVFLPKREGKASLAENQYPKMENVEYFEVPLGQPKWWRRFALFRSGMVREFDGFFPRGTTVVRSEVVKIEKDTRSFILRKIASFIPKRFLTNNLFTWLESFIVRDAKFFKEAVVKYKPSLVVLATPGLTFFEAWAIHLANKHGIPTCSMNASWDNLNSNFRYIRRTDYMILWNDVMKEEALKYYRYDPKKVFVSGVLRFDHYFRTEKGEKSRELFLKEKGLDPSLKTVLIATIVPGHYSCQDQLIRDVVEIREKSGEKFNILVRVHPIDNYLKYSEFTPEKIKNFHIERAGTQIKEDTGIGQKIQMTGEDLLNVKYTLKYSDVLVTPGSTMSLEAMIFDKPVMNPTMDPEHPEFLYLYHYRPLVLSEALRTPTTKEELNYWLKTYLDKPETDRENRKKIINRYVPFRDGLAYKRSVDFTEQIVKSLFSQKK